MYGNRICSEVCIKKRTLYFLSKGPFHPYRYQGMHKKAETPAFLLRYNQLLVIWNFCSRTNSRQVS